MRQPLSPEHVRDLLRTMYRQYQDLHQNARRIFDQLDSPEVQQRYTVEERRAMKHSYGRALAVPIPSLDELAAIVDRGDLAYYRHPLQDLHLP